MTTTWIALAIAAAVSDPSARSIDYAGDAKALDQLVIDNYAYPDAWPGGALPDSPKLKAEREAVHDRDSLLHYAEDRIGSLADHHAITGSSFRGSWALVPSYSDLWIEVRDGRFWIDAVRPDSPAAAAGIKRGDELTAVGGLPIVLAVSFWWEDLGLDPIGERQAFAARVIAAGRRDRPRSLTISRAGQARTVELPNLYASQAQTRPPITVERSAQSAIIRINNSLGDQQTIAAFDEAMASLPENTALTIDLTDTPSGGNTSVARAMMGWFVTKPTSYQVHRLPSEAKETGIERQWIEQVLPRPGKFHTGPLTVTVGRWTGSMGEGLAIGFKAIGAGVCGGPMAGLKGAVYDFTLPASGMTVKFPAERLYALWGQPREQVVFASCR